MSADENPGTRLRDARGVQSIDEVVADYRARFGKGGLSRGSLSRWENGHGWPSLDVLKGLCDVLGVAVESIDPASAERLIVLGLYAPRDSNSEPSGIGHKELQVA